MLLITTDLQDFLYRNHKKKYKNLVDLAAGSWLTWDQVSQSSEVCCPGDSCCWIQFSGSDGVHRILHPGLR